MPGMLCECSPLVCSMCCELQAADAACCMCMCMVSNLAVPPCPPPSPACSYAVVSAIAASALPALVMARGHKIEAVPEVPLVVSDAAGEPWVAAMQRLLPSGTHAVGAHAHASCRLVWMGNGAVWQEHVLRAQWACVRLEQRIGALGTAALAARDGGGRCAAAAWECAAQAGAAGSQRLACILLAS